MSHLFETAPTGRARCRVCRKIIDKGEWRLGQKASNPYGDGETTFWFHPVCGAAKLPEVLLEALAGADGLLPNAQKYRRLAELASAHRRLPRLGRIEVAPSGRARCRHCRDRIDKGSPRIALEVVDNGMLDPWGYVHLGCVRLYVEGDVVPLLEARGDVLDERTRAALSGDGATDALR
jgi:hypothetical protein